MAPVPLIQKTTADTSVVSCVLCPDYTAALIGIALQRALEPHGGLAAFVKPGQTVLVKPNLLSPRSPDQAVTTHPLLVAAVVRECRRVGAARVWVGDSPAGNHSEERLWRETGMADSVPVAGGELKSFRGPALPMACGGRCVPVPQWLPEVDVVISVAKLKTHLLTMLTGALKNVYGLIPGEPKSLFHGDYPSPRRMAGFLVDVFALFRPALSIVDAVVAMEGDGPSTGSPRHVGLILAGPDAAAIDACCATTLGLKPADIPMLAEAGRRGLGTIDPAHIRLCGDGVQALGTVRLRRSRGRWLQHLPEGVFRRFTWLLTYRPEVDQDLCVRCGVCAQTCSQQAIPQVHSRYRIDRSRCILCMCCLESCPQHAIRVRSPLLQMIRLGRRLRQALRRCSVAPTVEPPPPPPTAGHP